MRYLQEITQWDFPNHTYYVSDDKTKVVGYIKSGTKVLEKFLVPLRFDTRGRKYIEVKTLNPEKDEIYFNIKENQESKNKNNMIEIHGSNGKTYYLTKFSDGTISCTCPGYTFRKTCKHAFIS
jgi:hypothetical protein